MKEYAVYLNASLSYYKHMVRRQFLKFMSGLALLVVASAAHAENLESPVKTKKRVFLNASKNRTGNTAELAQKIFAGLEYKTVNLIDYHIDQIGQQSKSDQYSTVFNEFAHSDILVIGTPVYWSDMTGYLKTFIDRLPDPDAISSKDHPLKGTDVYLIVQGTAPEDAIPGITNVIEHVCRRFFMNYKGLIHNQREADAINKKIK